MLFCAHFWANFVVSKTFMATQNVNMTNDFTAPSQDEYTGYFASIILALLGSTMLASLVTPYFVGWFNLQNSDTWFNNITAGFFAAVVCANPVGLLIARNSIWRAGAKFLIGFLGGFLLQMTIIQPLAGAGVSRFIFLILAVMVLPIMYLASQISDYLERWHADWRKSLQYILSNVLTCRIVF